MSPAPRAVDDYLAAVVEAHREDPKGYDTAKSTVRFLPGQPLPAELVAKLVKARIAENEAAGKR